MEMTLTSLDTRYDEPDPQTIATVLAGLDGGRHVLATLGESELSYVQASGSVQSGFALDYQEGSLDRHYRSRDDTLSLERVTGIFQKYARGDATWRDGIDWAHDPFVPRRIPWHSTWAGYIAILIGVIALIWFLRR